MHFFQKNFLPTTTITTTAATTTTTSTTRQGAGTGSGGKSTANKRRGCRCGNATPTPGKLTCCGQRCPCYVDSKSCIGCKCRGCRNPHRPGGGKVRPIIPELACYEIQMADEQETIAASSQTNNNRFLPTKITPNVKVSSAAVTVTAIKAPASSPSSCLATSKAINVNQNATLIPLRNFQPNRLTTPISSIIAAGGNNVLATNPARNMYPNNSLTIQANAMTQPSPDAANNNILQLDQLPRESVLIQNADGKYQGKPTSSFLLHAFNLYCICSGKSVHDFQHWTE